MPYLQARGFGETWQCTGIRFATKPPLLRARAHSRHLSVDLNGFWVDLCVGRFRFCLHVYSWGFDMGRCHTCATGVAQYLLLSHWVAARLTVGMLNVGYV